MTETDEMTVWGPKKLAAASDDMFEVGKVYEGSMGMKFRRELEDVPGDEPRSVFTCAACGKTGFGRNGVQGHWNLQCERHPLREARDAAKSDSLSKVAHFGPVTRSKRGLKRQGIDRAPTVLEEIRDRPGGIKDGPAAFFIRPDGATIREALVINPNGAPVVKNGTDRGGSRMAQERAAKKGFEYIGPQLTSDGLRRLIQVIEANKYDYLLDLKEQIDDCEKTIKETETPSVRDNARKRRAQIERLIAIASRDIHPDQVMKELDEIMKAQKLAALSSAQREAITILLGDEVGDRIKSLASRMGSGKSVDGDGGSYVITNAPASDDF
jgi:hypothetical protein